MLSAISKNIITSRLYDNGIIISPDDLDSYLIDSDSFNDLNDMFNFIVANYGRLIIE